MNMARVTIEDCLKQVNNRFLLVHLGAKRVIQLRKGAKPLYEAPKNKEIVLALREIAAGEVSFESLKQIEADELSPKSVGSRQAPEEKDTPVQEVQEETALSEVEDSGGEETKQKDAPLDEAE
jgi:DNA-directed RNA polymerase subunit omega